MNRLSSVYKPALQTSIDIVLEHAIAQHSIVGAVVLVCHKEKITYQRAIGCADREAKIPMQENSIFRLASMTKPIVSITALHMVEHGIINLTDPITRWLPDFKPTSNQNLPQPTITLRHLLTHTAGLNYTFFENDDGTYKKLGVSDGISIVDFDLDENLQRIAKAPLLFNPGEHWHYSLATDVLGAIIAKANNSSLGEAVKKYVTSPLQMNDTSFTVTDKTRLTVPYADNKPAPIKMSEPYVLKNPEIGAIIYSPLRVFNPNAYQSGGGGLTSTTQDYMQFLEAFRTGKQTILTPETYAQFIHNATEKLLIDLLGTGWGFGRGVAVLNDPTANNLPMQAGTWTWSGVYGTNFFVDPKSELSVIILTNTALTGMIGEFPDAITAAIYQSDLLNQS